MSAAKLKSLEHSHDNRVIMATTVNAFYQMAAHSGYQAGILNSLTPEAKQRFRTAASQIYLRPNEKIKLAAKAHILADNRALKLVVEPAFDSLSELFQIMATHYSKMTGHQRIRIRIANAKVNPHAHEFDVLNIALNRRGTAWDNLEDKPLEANEGEFFFFKRKFKHYTTETGFIAIASPAY